MSSQNCTLLQNILSQTLSALLGGFVNCGIQILHYYCCYYYYYFDMIKGEHTLSLSSRSTVRQCCWSSLHRAVDNSRLSADFFVLRFCSSKLNAVCNHNIVITHQNYTHCFIISSNNTNTYYHHHCIILIRSVQPKPPAVAIVCQNSLSSASCRASNDHPPPGFTRSAMTPMPRQIW